MAYAASIPLQIPYARPEPYQANLPFKGFGTCETKIFRNTIIGRSLTFCVTHIKCMQGQRVQRRYALTGSQCMQSKLCQRVLVVETLKCLTGTATCGIFLARGSKTTVKRRFPTTPKGGNWVEDGHGKLPAFPGGCSLPPFRVMLAATRVPAVQSQAGRTPCRPYISFP